LTLPAQTSGAILSKEMMQKTTLLLDLDDTLLDTNIQAFVPAYFQALSSTLADEVSPEIMIPALTGGTKAMMENQDPAKTLREVFNSHFFPLLGVDKEAITAKIDHFYDKTFPALGYVASQRPEAISFVRWAFENNHRVAIATNPYFPLKAVQHRMNWAGLPAAENPFALVSSYETFHFTKESPTYFLEFLAQLGCPVGPVVMVGNDLEMTYSLPRKLDWRFSGYETRRNLITRRYHRAAFTICRHGWRKSIPSRSRLNSPVQNRSYTC
jgi:FMN phosphatase YigB (HAD superfamily)